MPIVPGLHAISLRGGASAFLVAEERLTLIDAGLPGSRPAIERAIVGIGRQPDELTRIVCTHGHPDHLGGAADFRGADVDVYLLIDQEKVKSLAIIASEPREFTIVNVIGSINLEQLHELEGKFGVPELEIETGKKTAADKTQSQTPAKK